MYNAGTVIFKGLRVCKAVNPTLETEVLLEKKEKQPL